MPMLCRLEVFDRLLAFAEPDVGLLPVLRLARVAADPADLARLRLGADLGDLGLEQLLDGPLDLDLVGPPGDLEADDPARGLKPGRLLRDHGADDDLMRVFDHVNLSRTASNARRLKTTGLWARTS